MSVEEHAQYIEIIGEASYEEHAEIFVAELRLEVRAAKEETSLDQLGDLRRRCVERLLSSGLSQDELFEAGAELSRPFWWKRKQEPLTGKLAKQSLRVRCKDIRRCYSALAAVEDVAANSRESITVEMRAPVFTTDESKRQAAFVQAIEKGCELATVLAKAGRAELGPAIRIEEGATAVRASGFTGDSDWSGDSRRFGGGGGGGGALSASVDFDSPEPVLDTPTRTLWVRCRVRFLLIPAKT